MSTEHRTAGNPWGLEPLLDVGALAAYLGVPVSTVYDWRTRCLGPRAYRFGKHLKDAVSDVRAGSKSNATRPRLTGGDRVARCHHFLEQLATQSYSRAK